MKIFEFQAKKLLDAYGVTVTQGDVATSAQQAVDICAQTGGERWMVKAQIRSGGRGEGHFANDRSLSGVQLADSPEEARRLADKMLNNVLHTSQTGKNGVTVKSVYIEKFIDFDAQYSLSLLVDSRTSSIVLLLSNQAGGHIETIAAEHPELIFKVSVDLQAGIDQEQLDIALAGLELAESNLPAFRKIIDVLVKLFIDKDASLIEINPLVLTNGKLVALDAKMAFDNNALYRHEDIQDLGAGHSFERSEDGLMASRDGFNYTELDGDIGILSVGAGLSLATIDAVKHYSGEPANFLDLPPDSRVTTVCSALELLLSRPNIKSILINVFGGGIMRCDAIADALLLVNQKQLLNKTPITVRLTGTNSNLAIRRIKEVIPGIIIAGDLSSAAKTAVSAPGAVSQEPVAPKQENFWAGLKSKFMKH